MFLFGFAKSARANIDEDELETAHEIARLWLGADQRALSRALEEGIIQEIDHGQREKED